MTDQFGIFQKVMPKVYDVALHKLMGTRVIVYKLKGTLEQEFEVIVHWPYPREEAIIAHIAALISDMLGCFANKDIVYDVTDPEAAAHDRNFLSFSIFMGKNEIGYEVLPPFLPTKSERAFIKKLANLVYALVKMSELLGVPMADVAD